ncbi:MAG: hypothetical protein LBO72_10710 [Helicobacteraceae bacterium]|nr:hypothetical protein [Helicobacteraceae bacterium]
MTLAISRKGVFGFEIAAISSVRYEGKWLKSGPLFLADIAAILLVHPLKPKSATRIAQIR